MMRQPKKRARGSRRPERGVAFNKAAEPAAGPVTERVGALPPCPTLAGYDLARTSRYEWWTRCVLLAALCVVFAERS